MFLPFRVHFLFTVDLKVFFTALPYPPEDPRSIHPAILNAIYLASCWIIGGPFNQLKPYFLAQTRLHMARSLETADRLMHFLWASLILGTFFALEGRMNEAYVTVSSGVEFALACGMDMFHYRHRTQTSQTTLLPPPVDEAESIERSKLSRALYLLDRTLAMINGTPSAFSGANGPLTRPILDVGGIENGSFGPAAPVSVTTEVR